MFDFPFEVWFEVQAFLGFLRKKNLAQIEIMFFFCCLLSNCIAWSSARVNQKGYVTSSYNVTHDEKYHYHDFVTYPEVLSNCIAWSSAWVNQKGYVTSSYNVTHDEKITITILLHILKYSATVLHGLQPG